MKPLLAALLVLAAAPGAGAQAPALLDEGANAAYNLDYDAALALYQQALTLEPDSPAAHRAIASLAWLQALFLRGTVTVDDYLGKLSSSEIKLDPAPPALADLFHRHVERAVQLAEQAVRSRPRDPSAHYDLGAALGLAASYQGSVEGKLFAAFKAARRAFDAHEKVLELDPSRKDAGLVVGTYRYAVSTLPAPMRWIAYMAGFGGGKEEGIRLLEAAAASSSQVQADARFALVLVYSRERRYDDALRVVRQLQESFPGNRLLWLEEGSTALRAKRPDEARRALDAGMAKLAADGRARIPGEEAYWRTKRATALVLLNERGAAEEDLLAALAAPDARTWVRARAHLELGKLADLEGDREAAKREYRAAETLGGRSNDPQTRDQAKRLARRAYARELGR
jgi:tetratricopeptide (TPR) repeat protein